MLEGGKCKMNKEFNKIVILLTALIFSNLIIGYIFNGAELGYRVGLSLVLWVFIWGILSEIDVV